MEKLIAIGKTWHKDCFRCGSLEGLGCNKKLGLTDYTDHTGCPYCKACYGKTFGPKGFNTSVVDIQLGGDQSKTAAAAGVSFGENQTQEVEAEYADASEYAMMEEEEEVTAPRRMSLAKNKAMEILAEAGVETQMDNLTIGMKKGFGDEYEVVEIVKPEAEPEEIRAPATAPVANLPSSVKPKKGVAKFLGGSASPKCADCGKTVYKMEELIAIGKTWHKDCFRCGASDTSGNGCKKKLGLTEYSDHGSVPWCKTCYTKGFGPKGFNMSVGSGAGVAFTEKVE